jgi:capsular exopolysaccharide synthesis family protein
VSEKYSTSVIDPEVSPADEYYRILFSGIKRRIEGGKVKSIAVTSAIKGEGKTTTVMQLAKVIARDFEKRVLLLEGDITNPSLNSILVNKPREGQAIGTTIINGLDVMTLGHVIKNKKMNGPAFASGLKKVIETVSNGYDYILIDCPPVLPMVDTQIIAGIVDGLIFVIRAEGPSRSLVKSALKSIPKEKVLGVVLNGMKTRWSSYQRGYGYY